MLRVEATNLPPPRLPRPRRLLPIPPAPQRRHVAPRDEIVPPGGVASAPTSEPATTATSTRPKAQERWSVRLELGDEDIAKLYGQGMTRGAVVWKKGMVEWRPLLITRELSSLLHRTRITLSDTPESATGGQPAPRVEQPVLPAPARLPSDMPPSSELRAVAGRSVAPTAMDVEAPPPRRARRPVELLAVGVAAFALAWLAHANLNPQPADPPPMAAFAAPAPACEPASGTPSSNASNLASTTLASSLIPTVSVADLPLAGAVTRSAAPERSRSRRGRARSTATTGSGRPSRGDLVSALSSVARAAGGCGQRGGPVRVVVSFANSGVASSIRVSGEALPSATRSCIIGAASRARVPAFTGDPVTVSKTL